MTTHEATRLYNQAEEKVKSINSNMLFIDRAIKIADYLEKMYGDQMADEILEFVYENEIK